MAAGNVIAQGIIQFAAEGVDAAVAAAARLADAAERATNALGRTAAAATRNIGRVIASGFDLAGRSVNGVYFAIERLRQGFSSIRFAVRGINHLLSLFAQIATGAIGGLFFLAARNTEEWKDFKDAVKDLADAVGEFLAPFLRVLTNVIRGATQAFQGLNPQVREAIINYTILGTILSQVVTGLITRVTSALTGVTKLIGIAFHILTAPVRVAGAALAFLAEAVSTVAATVIGIFVPVIGTAIRVVAELAIRIAYAAAIITLHFLVALNQIVTTIVTQVVVALTAMLGSIVTIVFAIVQFIVVITLLIATATLIFTVVVAAFEMLHTAVLAVFVGLEAAAQAMGKFAGQAVRQIPAVKNVFLDLIKTLRDDFPKAVKQILMGFGNFYNNTVDVVQKVVNGIRHAFAEAKVYILDGIDEIQRAILKPFANMHAALRQMFKGGRFGFDIGESDAGRQIAEIDRRMHARGQELMRAKFPWNDVKLDQLKIDMKEWEAGVDKIIEKMQAFAPLLANWFKQGKAFARDLLGFFAALLQQNAGGFTPSTKSKFESLDQYWQRIVTADTSEQKEGIDLIKGILEILNKHFPDLVGAVKGALPAVRN